MGLLKLACVVIVCMMVVAPHAEAAITCSIVSKSLAPCVGFLEGGSAPSSGCCNGVKTLTSLASTPTDRRTACGCLKSAAASFKSLDFEKAAQLPSKCGVTIGYAISPSIDCSKYDFVTLTSLLCPFFFHRLTYTSCSGVLLSTVSKRNSLKFRKMHSHKN